MENTTSAGVQPQESGAEMRQTEKQAVPEKLSRETVLRFNQIFFFVDNLRKSRTPLEFHGLTAVCGRTGTGKTTLLCNLAAAILAQKTDWRVFYFRLCSDLDIPQRILQAYSQRTNVDHLPKDRCFTLELQRYNNSENAIASCIEQMRKQYGNKCAFFVDSFANLWDNSHASQLNLLQQEAADGAIVFLAVNVNVRATSLSPIQEFWNVDFDLIEESAIVKPTNVLYMMIETNAAPPCMNLRFLKHSGAGGHLFASAATLWKNKFIDLEHPLKVTMKHHLP